MIPVDNLLIEIQYQLVEATSEQDGIITPHILQGYSLEKRYDSKNICCT